MSCKTPEEKEEKSHYVYVCTKGENSSQALENWDSVKEFIIKAE